MADTTEKPSGTSADSRKQESRSKDDSRDHRDRRNDRNGRGRGGGGRGRGGRGGGRGGNRGGDRWAHDKFDDRKPRRNETSDDPDEIRTQVEFYFSDSNLNKDRFLFEKCGGPENKPIDIETIASFSLMRRYKPFEAVVKALKESEVLEVNDKDQIYRKEPLVTLSSDFEENKRLLVERALPTTLYVKGFRIEQDYRDSQRKVQDFFKPYGIVEVRLRRLGDSKKLFKGSAYAEFPDVESAEKFSSQKHTFEGRDLEVLFKKDYIKREVDKIMEEFDVSTLEDAKKEEVLDQGRKVLEAEYMDPQAPSTDDAKKTEGAAADGPNIASEYAAKAKSKYQEKQNQEREERIRQRQEAQKKGGRDTRSATGANKQKRARDDDQQEEEHDSKRQRDDESATKPETDSSDKPEEQAAEKDVAAESTAEAVSEEKPTEAAA